MDITASVFFFVRRRVVSELRKWVDGVTSNNSARKFPFITARTACKFLSTTVLTSAVEGSNSWLHRWLLKLRFFPKNFIPRARFLHMWWNVRRIADQKLLERPELAGQFTREELEFLTIDGLVAKLVKPFKFGACSFY